MKYLNQWMEEIPTNCVLNKGITGCGATTLAIEQPKPTIIAMPFVGLVENKAEQHKDSVLGIYGSGDKTVAIAEYLNTYEQLKIATTYDSLPKVCRILQEQGRQVYEDTHLVVDEWHMLFHSYLFRNEAVKNLLKECKKFQNVTFISATPIEKKYWLNELQNYREEVIRWPNAEKIKIETYNAISPLDEVAKICRNLNHPQNNLHIFLNSVKSIAEIIRKADLHPDNTRVICSLNSENNKIKLPAGYQISKTSDPVKKINFYTSTCFEGQDIYDEYGQTIVVSDKYSNYTKLDISTSLIQVAGRIRNSIYKNHIMHIYAANEAKKDLSLQEYEESIKSNLEEAKHNAELLNKLSPSLKKKLEKTLSDNKDEYIGIVDGDIVVDENVANWDIVRYKLINGIYSSQVNMDFELERSGFEIAKSSQLNTPLLKMDSKDITKRSFREVFDEYCQLMENEPQFSLGRNFELEMIEINKPLVKEAYKVLGAEKVRELKYHQGNIKTEIVKKTKLKEDYKIMKLLKGKFPLQKAIPCKQIKTELKCIYEELGITTATKASDISR